MTVPFREASWRGIRFNVLNAETEFGRRVVTHEFVKRDKPQLEDMGRRSRTYKFSGFVGLTSSNGFNSWTQRDRIIAACEEKGLGVLIHPMFGQLEGMMASVKVSEQTSKNGGMVRLDFEFLEGGDAEYSIRPMPETRAKVASAADAVYAAIEQDLESLINLPTQDTISRIESTLRNVAKIYRQVSALRNFNVATALRIIEGLTGLRVGGLFSAAKNLIDVIKASDNQSSYKKYTVPKPARTLSSNKKIEAANATKLQAGIRAVSAAKSAQTAVEFLSSQRYSSESVGVRGVAARITKTEARAYRKQVSIDLSDAYTELSDSGMEKSAIAVRALQTNVIKTMTEKSESLMDVVYASSENGLVGPDYARAARMAYEFSGRLDDDVLVARNRIRHPLFVPPMATVELVK